MHLRKLLLVLVSASLFPWLFFEKEIGINLFIFNLIIIGGLAIVGRLELKRYLNLVVLTGTLLTAVFVVFNGSDLAITINILSLFLLAGTSIFPIARNLIFSALLSIINFFYSQYDFIGIIGDSARKLKGVSGVLRFLKIIIIPVIIVIVFILIYKAANPVFEGMMKNIFDAVEDFFNWFFSFINFPLFWTFVLGLLFANYFFLGKPEKTISEAESKGRFTLLRKRRKTPGGPKITSLKNEYKSAIILFALLNILILIINAIDIWWVWFNFTWNGEYLKQFVHEGTYLLILSILISLAISIFYFRGNINFLKNNIVLKRLAYLWLFQNAILTISVGIRNFWYINYFSLAYLRIGVVFFLLLTLFSIVTVFIKIRDKKTTFYLFSKNALAAYLLLVAMAFFNWDIIIAKYNFKHSSSSFLHFDFMSDLSESALPYLVKTRSELSEIDMAQKEDFPFRKNYMTSDEYFTKMKTRKSVFIEDWPQQKWQEWNWAGERSFRKLLDKK